MEAHRIRRQPEFDGISVVLWCSRWSDFWVEGGRAATAFLGRKVLSPKEPGIDRPSARSDHRQGASQDRQQKGRFIARSTQADPYFDDYYQCPRQGRPETHQDKQAQHSPSELRNNRPSRGKVVQRHDSIEE